MEMEQMDLPEASMELPPTPTISATTSKQSSILSFFIKLTQKKSKKIRNEGSNETARHGEVEEGNKDKSEEARNDRKRKRENTKSAEEERERPERTSTSAFKTIADFFLPLSSSASSSSSSSFSSSSSSSSFLQVPPTTSLKAKEEAEVGDSTHQSSRRRSLRIQNRKSFEAATSPLPSSASSNTSRKKMTKKTKRRKKEENNATKTATKTTAKKRTSASTAKKRAGRTQMTEEQKQKAALVRRQQREQAALKKKQEQEEAMQRRLREKEEQRSGVAVFPFVYLGSKEAAANYEWLRANDCHHVLNVASEVPKYFHQREEEGFSWTYMHIEAQDSEEQKLLPLFERATYFIHEAVQKEQNVLVHCNAGLSRSVTILIAYAMKHLNFSLKTAYEHVKAKRPRLNPNNAFKQQLMQFEEIGLGLNPSLDFFARTKRLSACYGKLVAAQPPEETEEKEMVALGGWD